MRWLGRWPEISLDDARSSALRVLQELSSGSRPTSGSHTVADLVDFFAGNHRTSRSRRPVSEDRNAMRRLNTLRAELGHWRLPDVTTQAVSKILKPIERRAPYEHNRTLRQIKQLWAYAKKLRWLPGDAWCPASVISEMPERKRSRNLTEAEVQRIYEAASASTAPHARAVIKISMITASRPGELMTLRWEDVTDTHFSIREENTKAGRSRRYPICQRIRSILDELRSVRISNHPYVFEGRKPFSRLTSIRGVWKNVTKAAGLEDVQMKDLRHARATTWIRQGVAPTAVMKALDHKDLSTTMRYLDLVQSDHEHIFFAPISDASHSIE